MRRGRRLLGGEAGLSVIEVTIAAVLVLVVIGSALSLLDSGTKSERTSQARHDAEMTLRNAVGRITKEVRQATAVDSTSNQSNLYMKTLVGGTEYWIAYQVTGSPPNAILSRKQCASSTSSTTISCLSTAPTAQIADRVVAPQAFCYQFDDPDCLATSPTSTLSAIHISLQVTPVIFSQGTITLATDVQLRNIH